MKLGSVVLDSDNPGSLSDFYQKLLGWEKSVQVSEGETWFVVYNKTGEGVPLVFQEVNGYSPPVWPAENGMQQQQVHLDFYVEAGELDDEVSRAVSYGARVSGVQFSDEWRVLLDPAGHPFCIIPIPPDAK